MLAVIRNPRALLLLGLALGLALAALLVALRARPTAAQEDPFVARGRYLVTAGACAECHTQRAATDPLTLDAAKFLGGGEEFALPFGTLYSSNITSDVGTGIGSWTVAEVVKALDEGVSKDGTPLVLMPWQEFRGMATTDKVAIAIYLKSTEAVTNAVPAAVLQAPRAALYADAAKNARPIGPGSPPEASDALATGEYLVWNALGCQGCHGADLSGGVPPFFAPNITSDVTTGIGSWTEDQIITAVRTGTKPDGKSISPAMPWGARAYGNLTDADARAVAKYLKTVTPVSKVVVSGRPPAPAGGDITLNPLWLAAAGALLLLMGLGVLRLRLRRALR